MYKVILLTVASFLFSLSSHAEQADTRTEAIHEISSSISLAAEADDAGTSIEIAESCCKICRKGKACGNSCIAQSKTCHQGSGCACNGYADSPVF